VTFQFPKVDVGQSLILKKAGFRSKHFLKNGSKQRSSWVLMVPVPVCLQGV
jgi:hypothetical protein